MHSRKGLHRQDSLVIHQHRSQCGFDSLTVDIPRWLWEERRVILSWNPPTFMSFPCFPLIILPWLSFPEYATHPPLLPSWQSTPVSGVCIFQNKLLFILSMSLHWIFSLKMKGNKKREPYNIMTGEIKNRKWYGRMPLGIRRLGRPTEQVTRGNPHKANQGKKQQQSEQRRSRIRTIQRLERHWQLRSYCKEVCRGDRMASFTVDLGEERL